MTDKPKPGALATTRRLPGEDRRRAIIAEAVALFSETGFDVSTRDIARRCGITQAALYKHFASKDAIIEAVFRSAFLDQDRSDFAATLADLRVPLEARIAAAYRSFFGSVSRINQRLFVRAALAGFRLPADFAAPLDHEMLEPLAAQLRAECGLPALDAEPMVRKERELMLMLHSAVVFLALRRNVYNIPLDDDADWIIDQDVRVWLAGAIQHMKEIWSV